MKDKAEKKAKRTHVAEENALVHGDEGLGRRLVVPELHEGVRFCHSLETLLISVSVIVSSRPKSLVPRMLRDRAGGKRKTRKLASLKMAGTGWLGAAQSRADRLPSPLSPDNCSALRTAARFFPGPSDEKRDGWSVVGLTPAGS